MTGTNGSTCVILSGYVNLRICGYLYTLGEAASFSLLAPLEPVYLLQLGIAVTFVWHIIIEALNCEIAVPSHLSGSCMKSVLVLLNKNSWQGNISSSTFPLYETNCC